MRSGWLILLLIGAASLTSSAQTSKASNLFPIQEGFVDSHGALIYYESVGSGAPLMIVHGGPGASHDYFLPYLLPLMRTNRLVFIDERGSGKSSKLDDPSQYTVAQHGGGHRSRPPSARVRQDQPSRSFLRWRVSPGLRVQVSEESFAPHPRQHVRKHHRTQSGAGENRSWR